MIFSATGICGSVKGSVDVTYAMVFGRWLFGSEAIHCAKGTSPLATGNAASKTLVSPAWNTEGAPPAPSTMA